MRVAWLLLVGHAVALVFGLAGMLIALPHPELWAGSRLGAQTFAFGMQYAGPLHIILGAAAMAVFGWRALGWRRTAIFLVAACALSLSSELIGTGTGWPFGNYAYTERLGTKVLGRVPFSIPLSWFYMGFAAYLLGTALAGALQLRHRTAWSLGLGVFFLTVWDLALDPAMAAPTLPLQFWVWHESGGYFGMPIQNLVGWSATGLVFMGVSRLLFRGDPIIPSSATSFPLAMYALNTLFALVLSAAAGLWLPVALAVALGLVPAMLAWWWSAPSRPRLVSQPAA